MHVTVDVLPKYHPRIQGLYSVRDLLRDSGVSLEFESGKRSDLLLTQDKIIHRRGGKGLPKTPTIVFERIDSSVVGPLERSRLLLKAPSVKYWFKEMAARDPSLHNAETVDGRYHFALLEPASERKRKPSILLEEPEQKKIRPLLPMFLQDRYADIRNAPVLPWRERPIDLFCAGGLHDDRDILSRHRRQALRYVESSGRNYVVIAGNLVSKETYNDILRRSKMVLSPYGLGEYSYKDFEAIYAGCLLIKPNSSFCTCYSLDIFGGGYCVQTKPDMSDFPDVLAGIYDNYKHFREMAARSADELRHAFVPESYARDLLEVFKRAVEA